MTIACLFLGAGASKAIANYPTTKEFMENLEKYLNNQEKKILKIICNIPDVEDIENVLEVLDPIVMSEQNAVHNSISRLGLTAQSENDNVIWSDFLKYSISLKQKIIENLHREYSFQEYKIISNSNFFLEFFARIHHNLNAMEADNYFNFLNVITTNYDKVVEELFKEQIKIYDFFVFDPKTERYFWDPHFFDRIQSDPNKICLKLFKLHGSLDWRETTDGKFEKCPSEDYCAGSDEHKRNILIYPTEKGFENEEPFKTNFEYFRRICKRVNRIVVIGCSFRDPEINEIFIEFLKYSNGNKIIVVSPDASIQINQNLLKGIENKNEFTRLNNQINKIDKPFNDQTKGQVLDSLFNSSYWRRL